MSAAGHERECHLGWAWDVLGVRGPQPEPQACPGLMPQDSGNKFVITEELM